MPEPSRKPETGRPNYSREQQEQCLLVRRTNCGINGKPILFYAQSLNRPTTVSRTKKRTTRGQNISRERGRQAPTDPLIEELQQGLAQLGVTGVPEQEIRRVLAETYPDGHANVPTATLLMTLFRSLKRQDSPDNVAG